MEQKRTVLIVEDEKSIVDILRFNLEKEGYAVLTAYDGESGLEQAISGGADLILLDVMLPKMNGFDVCRRLREGGSSVPVIILTARDGLDDRLEGLDAGADDYLVKPFHMSELLARIRAVLRRKNKSTENTLTNGLVTLNTSEKTATLAGADSPITLSRREYALLAALLARPGSILSRRRIEESIYEPGEEPESNAVEYLIHSLRKKLGPEVIKNVRGLGWMVEKGSGS